MSGNMAPPWVAEHAIDAAQARALVAAHMPTLPDVAPELVGAGWDNVVWRFGPWAVRFPRRRVAARILEHEIAALPRLAARLPLPVPYPEHVAGPTPDFPARFAAYRLLPGDTADRVAPPDARKPALATALAHFLATLHAQPVDELLAAGVPDMRFRGAVARHSSLVEEYIARIETLPRVAAHADVLRALLAQVAGAARDGDFAACVLHGDLHTRHVLLEADGSRVTGIIDWGDVCIGDPATDLRIGWMWLSGAARAAFRAALPLDSATWARARLHALKIVAALLAWSADVGDSIMLREAVASIARVAED